MHLILNTDFDNEIAWDPSEEIEDAVSAISKSRTKQGKNPNINVANLYNPEALAPRSRIGPPSNRSKKRKPKVNDIEIELPGGIDLDQVSESQTEYDSEFSRTLQSKKK